MIFAPVHYLGRGGTAGRSSINARRTIPRGRSERGRVEEEDGAGLAEAHPRPARRILMDDRRHGPVGLGWLLQAHPDRSTRRERARRGERGPAAADIE